MYSGELLSAWRRRRRRRRRRASPLVLGFRGGV
jgi:hypothetical protein